MLPTETASASPASDPSQALTSMRVGQRGALQASDVTPEDAQLLGALGLEIGATFRLCKTGGPWIVQVGATRIGLAPEIARRLVVQPVS